MAGKITIIDGNNEIELTTIEKDVRAYMIKGEPGSDGISPTATVSKVDDTTTITITDKNGTTSSDVVDGFDPTVTVSRTENLTTLTITDIDGTRTTDIYDGIDLTGGVPTDGVIGWETDDLAFTCDGTETGDYYLTYNSVDYYFTMPEVEEGDILLFNTTDLELSLNGTQITTSSSGTGTELTFIDYIPNGYEATTELQEKLVSGTNIKTINNNSILGSGNIEIQGGGSATGDTLPIGAVVEYPKVTPPTGWLVCDGSEVSRTTYAELFAVIGTTHGSGDGSTTFNLPNKKGRVGVGYDSNDTDFNAIGKTGGEKTHTLTINEIPSHNHGQVYSDSVTPHISGWLSASGSTIGYGYNNTGGGQAHNNLPPYIATQYIIKATQSAGLVANVVNVPSQSTSDTYSCSFIESLLQKMYPVGCIYMTTDNTNPATTFGFGTWSAWGTGRVPVGVDTSQTEFNTVEKTGGEKTHTLTISEMPRHNHRAANGNGIAGYAAFQRIDSKDGTADGYIDYTGGDQAHNNLQPYITCYMWKRTA